MTTAQDVIAEWMWINGRCSQKGSWLHAKWLIDTLVSAPDSVRLELIAMLLPKNAVIAPRSDFSPAAGMEDKDNDRS